MSIGMAGGRAQLVATLDAPPSPEAREIRDADWIEVRAEVTGELDAGWLRNRFRGGLIYSLGAGMSAEARCRRLCAAREYDLIDLDGERDLLPEVLEAIPRERRLISWHGPGESHEDLRRRFERYAEVGATLIRLVPCARVLTDGLAPLSLLKSLRRPDLLAYASGESGYWTRPLAARLGAPWLFGQASESPGGTGGCGIARLIEDFGAPLLWAVDEVFGIAGDPVLQAYSTRLHNAAYRALGRKALYLPFPCPAFADLWKGIVAPGALDGLGFPLRGITTVSPHKEAALAQARISSALSRQAGAANLMIRHEAGWTATTTDALGVLEPLRRRSIPLAGTRAAVLGCGGAGRAVAAALSAAGAEVLLVNRGKARGHYAAHRLGLPFVPLARFAPAGFDLIVNATPLGRGPDECPFDAGRARHDTVIADFVYGRFPTRLTALTCGRGLRVIDGHEILGVQVREQFRRLTGQPWPEQVAATPPPRRAGQPR
ncbi:MAG: type I 3-dehydroquinate dehydratase [Gammaproteobacteria bacterium]